MDENNKGILTPAEGEKKTNPRGRKIASIIGFSLAGLAVLALIGTILITFINANNKVTQADVTAFKSEKQLASKLKTVIKQSNSLYTNGVNYLKKAIDDTNSTEASEAALSLEQNESGSASDSSGKGSNEADTVKTDDKYIYMLNSSNPGKISIFAVKGDSSNYVAEIKVSNKENETFVIKDFFLNDKKLIAVEQASVNVSSDKTENYTQVEVFDLSDIKNIKGTAVFTQSGSPCSSRMREGELYVASVHHASDAKDLPRALSGDMDISKESDSDVIPAKDIYCVENPNEPNFMVVSEINLGDSSNSAVTKAVLGSANDVYCGSDYMYITSYEYNYDLLKKEGEGNSSYTHLPVNNTQIVKVDLGQKLNITASAKVIGYTDNQYSFDDNGSNLRVTSTVTLDNDKFTESANIFVLDKSLKCVGKLTDFASDKSVKSVSYIDDTAYVTSYKSTDPMFVIDLKKASEPRLLCEKKLDGASSMLVPVDDKTLLSIGYYTADEKSDDSDGIKLVTLDISNKSNPKVSDSKVFKNYESPAQSNQKALLVNTERNDFTIPMIFENYNESKGKNEIKYGLLNFKVEDGKINIVNDYTSSVFTASDETYTSLDRCVYSGNYIYLLGSSYNFYNTDGTALIEAVKY